MYKVKNKFYFSTSIIFILIFSFLLIYLSKQNNNEIILTNNWTLYINDELISSNFSLEENLNVNIEDKIILETIIPQNSYIDPTIEIMDRYFTIQAYLNDELIYEYGLNEYEKGEMLVDGYKYIKLGNNCSDKKLKLIIMPTERGTFSNLGTIKLSEGCILIKNFIRSNIFDLFIGIFMFSLGIVLLFLYSFEYIKDQNSNESMFYISLYSIFAGQWTLSYSGLLNLLIENNIWIKYIEYIGLYATPITALGFLSCIKEKDKDECVFNKKFVGGFKWLLTVTTFILFLLHYLKIIHLRQSLIVFHVLLLSFMFSLAIIILKDLSNFKKNANSIVKAFVFLIGCVFIDLIRFNIVIYNFNISKMITNNISAIGVVYLLYAFIASYYNETSKNLKKITEDETLRKLAFLDVLTQLHNRAWYEKYIESIPSEYAMISFDLNCLKQTNDDMGHIYGDKLIKGFADALKLSFKNGHCIRFGGDEFLVIVENIDKEKIEEHIKLLENNMNKISKIIEIEIKTSYGIAFSNESTSKSPKEVYKLADNRMYDMKKKLKKLI